MRKLVIGDIHSGLRALEQVLQKAEVNHEDLLIFLGDYVDGWSEAVETVDYLIQLKKTHNCIFIRGNHDELCKDWLKNQIENPTWLAHGGEATRQSYLKVDKRTWETHIDFYESLQNYYLDDENRLFLHAGFTNLKGVEYEYFKEYFYWDRTLWELAQTVGNRLAPGDTNYPKRLANYNEIFIGHTPISKTGMAEPKKAANVWNVDTGAAFKGPLTMMDVETKEFWQSDPVHTQYSGERGRN
ncbi:metallophosphoesterase family protein [Allomuricauda sp. d1]|uniref:metallophosphoesterase family protein n=1 Tax=Allomuricauda sp. d1 TaxID=3136725 RepID=UPI0031D4FCC7